jgi:hypothetical protein
VSIDDVVHFTLPLFSLFSLPHTVPPLQATTKIPEWIVYHAVGSLHSNISVVITHPFFEYS